MRLCKVCAAMCNFVLFERDEIEDKFYTENSVISSLAELIYVTGIIRGFFKN